MLNQSIRDPPADPEQFPKLCCCLEPGASRGCGGLGQNEPPTSKQLYGVLQGKFPNNWGRLEVTLHHSFERKFELGMEQMCEIHRDIFDYPKDLAVLMSTYRIGKFQDNLY